MLTKFHSQITRKALSNYFNEDALNQVVKANIKQDSMLNQFGRAHLHFDDNKFAESLLYMNHQRDLLFANLEQKEPSLARKNFGRLSHTCQDLYAHSNYVSLWIAKFEGANLPSPESIDPCDEEILLAPNLTSGHLYYPLEALSFIPLLNKLVIPLLPPDSHARMNLDGPDAGDLFPYAFEAAVKRTIIEFEEIASELTIDK